MSRNLATAVFFKQIVVAMLFGLSGCASHSGTYSLEPSLVEEKASILFVEKSVQVVSVNGAAVSFSPSNESYYKVLLPPGQYRLEVAFSADWRIGSVGSSIYSENNIFIDLSAVRGEVNHLFNSDALSRSFAPKIKSGPPISELLKNRGGNGR